MLKKISMTQMRKSFKERKLSPVDVAQTYLENIKRAKSLNAYIWVDEEEVLKQARASQERLRLGVGGALEGIPLALKDNFCTIHAPTTAASKMLENYRPFYESTVSERFWEAGAILMGKTNMDQFSMGSSNESSFFGPCISPWRKKDIDAKLVAGGSSGGSAVAVAANLCAAATGTDTGGSIRQPASFNGTVGMKPTYGRCSRFGLVALGSSLDQAGFLTQTVEDAALLLQVCAGFDPRDSMCSSRPVPCYEEAFKESLKGMRVGIPKEYSAEGISHDVKLLWNKGLLWLKEAGCTIVDVSLPTTHYALPIYYALVSAEVSSNLTRYDGVRFGYRCDREQALEDLNGHTREQGFGFEVRKRIMAGNYLLSQDYYERYYIKAQKARRLVAEDFKKVFETVDVLLTPTVSAGAFELGTKDQRSMDMYFNDSLVAPASLAGLPAISVPGDVSQDGLPLGLQVIGRPFDEKSVLKVARAIERSAHFLCDPEPWWFLERPHKQESSVR